MIILFLHRSFPGQFKYIASELAKDPLNVVMFITAEDKVQIKGLNKLVYKPNIESSKTSHSYLKGYEECVLHGQAAASILMTMKEKGIKPDIIFGFSWGPPMFVKEIFPDVPFLCYFEWFGRSKDSVFDFGGNILNEDTKAYIKCHNSHVLIDLYECDAGITPTHWQKKQFPKEFHDKIKVIHDGVDTEICKPNKDATFIVKDKNLELTAKDEVITYATSGMEPYRGFPQFMEAVEQLLKKRPNAHFVIGGEDRVCYGKPLAQGTYKELMLKKLKIDLNRVHFVGRLSYEEYIKLLQISSVHVYLTYPFILSWSILEAMAIECCIVASNTKPVLEIMEDSENGLLVDFFDINQLVDRIEYALDNPDEMQKIKSNARQTIIDKYDLKDCLAQQIEYIESLIRK